MNAEGNDIAIDKTVLLPPRQEVLGVRVDILTPAEALQWMQRMCIDGGHHHVVTVNPEFIMAARISAEFRRVIAEADLALPDGIGVVMACRLYGHRLAQRVTGVDTVRALAGFAAKAGLRPFLLGAAPGVAERAAEVLCCENPGLQIAGTFAGSPHPDDETEIVERVHRARPDMLFVAYGAPQQDLWIARTRERLKVPLAMGVGGTFDFIAGIKARAPMWVQRAGLEWLHRLIQEPWRWRRMCALPYFALLVVLERIRPTRVVWKSK